MVINKNSIIILDCSRRSKLFTEMKGGWGRRAAWLNTLPHPGKFEYLDKYNFQNGNILEYLTLEWQCLIGVLISVILPNPRTLLSYLEVCFGKERVKIRSQSYCKFDISFILQLLIFRKGFIKPKSHEIISNTKKRILIHIELEIRIQDLFNLRGLCGVCFKENGW